MMSLNLAGENYACYYDGIILQITAILHANWQQCFFYI